MLHAFEFKVYKWDFSDLRTDFPHLLSCHLQERTLSLLGLIKLYQQEPPQTHSWQEHKNNILKGLHSSWVVCSVCLSIFNVLHWHKIYCIWWQSKTNNLVLFLSFKVDLYSYYHSQHCYDLIQPFLLLPETKLMSMQLFNILHRDVKYVSMSPWWYHKYFIMGY